MKILLSGASGAMGKVVSAVAAEETELDIICGFGAEAVDDGSFPIVADLDQAPTDVDVILDFSLHTTAPALAAFATTHRIPLVVATTGHTDEELEKIQEAASSVPVFYSGNMSIGVYVLRRLTEEVAGLLPDFDIEITEAHHHHKQDAPSGTAKMLISAAKAARPELTIVPGRDGHTGARNSSEIGVHALRGGTIVGEHTVLFAGTDEMIEIKHTALSKAIFAKGALKACRFLVKQKPGMYNMDDLNR